MRKNLRAHEIEALMGPWMWLWMACMLLFFITPVGYGFYRGWGPPYPRYLQRRRAERAVAAGGAGTFNHVSWGFGGDLMWMVLLVGSLWLFLGFLWR